MKIFSLFNQEKNSIDPYWVFDSQIHFRPKLNRGAFFKLTGFDFGWLLMEPISAFIADKNLEIEKGKSLSYGQKSLYYWWYLDAQVTNGGFVQFYYNGYGSYVPTIIKGLTYIGDKKMAAIVQQAENIYQKNKKLIDKAREKDLFGSNLYDQLEAMSALDNEYYKLNKQTMSNLEKYIKKNPNEICLDEDGQEFDLKFSGECKTFYPDNSIREQFYLENGIINGAFISFYPDGKIKEEIQYQQGEPTGERVEYYKNGHKKNTVSKDLSSKQFAHHWYYENGILQKVEHKHLDKDERIGVYKEWFDNGQLEKTGNYISNHTRDGEWLEFYKDGGRKLESEFQNGDLLIKNFWTETGEQILKNGDGLYIHEYNVFKDQISRYEQTYKNYRRHGEQKSFTNGILSLYEEMENGKEHGYTRSYYKNGKLKDETLYKNGEIVSTKLFPKSDNPVCKVSLKYLMKEEWLQKENLPIADSYPVCINEEEIKKQIATPPLLLDIKHHDLNADTCLWLSVDEKGNITGIKIGSSYLTNGQEFLDVADRMKFQPATKDGKNVASFIYIIATFHIE